MTWERDDSGLSIADIEKRQPYKFDAHYFGVRRRLPWLVCKRCGLVNLRNELTAFAVKVGCNAGDHPEYKARCRAARPRR